MVVQFSPLLTVIGSLGFIAIVSGIAFLAFKKFNA